MKHYSRNAFRDQRGMTLIEILAYVALTGVLFGLAMKVFMSGHRLSASATTVVDQFREQEAFRRVYTGAIREGAAIVERAGDFVTGDTAVVMALPASDGGSAERFLVVGETGDPGTVGVLTVRKEGDRFEVEGSHALPGTFESVRFEYDGATPEQSRAVTLVGRFEAEEGARKPRAVHRFTASLRGIGT